MTRFSSRALAGAAITVLLGSFAVVPAVAEEIVPATPVVSWVGITEKATFAYGQVPSTVGCTAVDQLGAPLLCRVDPLVPVGTVGSHTLTAVVAGANVATLTYEVTPTWTLKGFYKPVKNSALTRKAGSTIPLKFKIYNGDRDKSKTVLDISTFVAMPVPCADQTVATGSVTYDFKASVKYRDGAFHKNWHTDKLKPTRVTVNLKHGKTRTTKTFVQSCYQVTMTAVDGQFITALVTLKK